MQTVKSLVAFEVEVKPDDWRIVAKVVDLGSVYALYRKDPFDVAFLRKWGAFSFDDRIRSEGWLDAYKVEAVIMDVEDGRTFLIPRELFDEKAVLGDHGESVQAYVLFSHWEQRPTWLKTTHTKNVIRLGPVNRPKAHWEPLSAAKVAPEPTRRFML
jgi:hypothetical protein